MEEAPETTSENKPLRDERGRLLPGNTANPDGRPKGTLSITSLVKAELERIPEGQEKTYAELFIKKILHKALIEGDSRTQKLIWNYIDGLPKGSMSFDIDKEGIAELTAFFRAMGNES